MAKPKSKTRRRGPTPAERDASRRDAYEQFERDIQNGALRDSRNPNAVVFEPEEGEPGEWNW